MILLEGSDNVGKTTLAKEMQKLINSAYVHYGPMPLWWTRYEYITRAIKHAVYDRYHWSAAAYREISPQPWPATAEICRDIDEMFMQCYRGCYGTICLYTSKPDETYHQDFKDYLFTRDQVIAVNAWYQQHQNDFTLSFDIAQGYPNAHDVLRMLNACGIDTSGRL